MNITMDDSRILSIAQLREFLKVSRVVSFGSEEVSVAARYEFIDQTIDRFRYKRLRKKDKRTVIRYIRSMTGYKGGHLYRLVKRAERGKLARKLYKRENPNLTYTAYDIKLLEKTDELHSRLNTFATKEIMRRECEVFGREEYAHIAQVSPSHINNLRQSPAYRNTWVNHTRPNQIPIGLTQKPENFGRPGSIRVDTVHQRDVYHLNSVDEVTQWEVVACVPQISEWCMEPALIEILSQYPFVVFNFHSDRGGETINQVVSELLQRMLIKQTKSRSRHPNDNALVESKNGTVIRKNMGWRHINQDMADMINQYYRDWFNPYLNFHRPCMFATGEVTSPNGRTRKTYGQTTMPYEKLKEVGSQKGKSFLKPKVSFEKLDKIAYRYSDNQFAKLMREKEGKLFEKIGQYRSGSLQKSLDPLI